MIQRQTISESIQKRIWAIGSRNYSFSVDANLTAMRAAYL